MWTGVSVDVANVPRDFWKHNKKAYLCEDNCCDTITVNINFTVKDLTLICLVKANECLYATQSANRVAAWILVSSELIILGYEEMTRKSEHKNNINILNI